METMWIYHLVYKSAIDFVLGHIAKMLQAVVQCRLWNEL